MEEGRQACLFVLRFYGPVNPMGSCRALSVYLTTHLLGRLSPLSGLPVLCTFFRQRRQACKNVVTSFLKRVLKEKSYLGANICLLE